MRTNKNIVSSLFKSINAKATIYVSIILLIILQVILISSYFINNAYVDFKVIISSCLAASVVLLFLILLAFWSLMNSMKNLVHSSKELSEGNLNINDIIILENNDFKVLAKAFNQLKTNLLFFIDNTKKNITTLSDSIDKVSTSMNTTCNGNENMAASIQNIASNAHNELVLVKDTVEKIDSIHSIIDKISEHINDVEKMALNSNSKSIEGLDSINTYSETMKIMSDSVSDTGEFISTLRKSISEIAKVTDFIFKISDDLRLLSLNASIEAARSGEAGRGFSVVANEITKLSDSTKEEITKVNLIISNVLNNSAKVESSITKSVSDFEKGKEIFINVKDVFNDIHDKNAAILKEVSEVVSEAANINSISKETYMMSQKVYDSSSSISEASNSVSVVIEEEVSEFQEINTTVSSLQDFVEKISKLTTIFDIGAKPINNTTSKKLKIAFVVPSLKESFFWNTIFNGASYAKKELINNNADIELIPITHTGSEEFVNIYTNAIDQCIKDNYNGICIHGSNDKFIPIVDKAASKGIPVVTFNTDFTSPSKRLACVSPNSYEAGAMAGEIMRKEINGKGRILIVSNKLHNTDSVLKSNGFSDYIKKQKDIEIVDSQHTAENGENTYKLFKEYLSQNNKNINGIFLCGTYKHNIAKAIEELGLAGKIKFIVYDVDAVTCDYIKKNVITSTIGLDPFSQGHDSIVHLYNYLISGNKPKSENMWTRMELIDRDNVNRILS